MDLAVYIGDLLSMHGEVIVPGLGSFVQTRTNAWYNESEDKFYPPANQVMFDPQTLDDDTLAEYISSKKNISLSSSKYFVDKYITNLREQIALYEVAFTDIGWLYAENSKLVFKAKEALNPNDQEFYGLGPVKITRLGRTPVPDPEEKPNFPQQAFTAPEPVLPTEPEPAHAPITSEAAVGNEQTVQDEEEVYEKRGISLWLFIALILVVLAAGAFALYKYKPGLLNVFIKKNKQTAVIAPVKKKITVVKAIDTSKKADSVAKNALAHQTDAIAAPAIKDVTRVKHWEILAGAFKLLSQADNAMKNFKTVGLNCQILPRVQGRLYKITLGTYLKPGDAMRARDSLIKSGKIQGRKLSIQPYNPIK